MPDPEPHRDCLPDPGLYAGHPVVHFDVPTDAGRRIFSIQCYGDNQEAIVSPLLGSRRDQLAAARPESGPVILVFVDRNGKYFTDYASPRIGALMLKVLSRLDVGATASAQALEQPDVSSLRELFHTASLEELSASISLSSMGVRVFSNWGITFYIRKDHSGLFRTYPDVGGPFHSSGEANGAIDCYLRDREDPTLRIDPDDPDLLYHVLKSTRERAIQRILCWPDGTRKLRLQSVPVDERRCRMLQMVRALLDKYNDDNNLLEDLAYDLQSVVCYHVFNEGGNNRRMYYHVNFTAKTKDRDDLLFFAEAMDEKLDELVVSCICRVNPFDEDMGYCYGCSSDVKHPKAAGAYSGGHSSARCLLSTYNHHGPREDLGFTAAQLEAEEARVRRSYKGPRDPNFLVKLREPMKVNFPPPRPVEETLAFITSCK